MTMRNRKTVIAAFVLVAALLMAVGFAALNTELTIDANLGAITDKAEETFDGDIKFTDKLIRQDDTNAATCVIDAKGDTATITADKFSEKNQKVYVVLTITNTSTEFDGRVTVRLKELTSQHEGVFSATCEWYVDGQGTGNLDAKTIAGNNGYAQVLVTLTLNETPVEAHTATYKVQFNVESVEMTSNG